MRATLIAACLMLVAGTTGAAAGEGLTPDAFMGGTGIDWIERVDGQARRVTQLQVAYAYDTPLGGGNVQGEALYGISVMQRVLVFPGVSGENPADWITELSIDWWWIWGLGGNLETYVGGAMAIWGDNIDGEGQELFGPRLGLRWDLDDTTAFEVGYRHYFGREDRRQNGIIFGPRFLIG